MDKNGVNKPINQYIIKIFICNYMFYFILLEFIPKATEGFCKIKVLS